MISAVGGLILASSAAWSDVPRTRIFQFDVNTGDATLVLSPSGRGVLIDAGDKGRGEVPIADFLDRAKADGDLVSLDFVIATHYDADHVGGMPGLFARGWYPQEAVLDRGNSFLPPLDREAVCPGIDPDAAEQAAPWGTAPSESCPASSRRASCRIIQYIVDAEAGGKRRAAEPGEVITLDHGLELEILVVNAEDVDGDTVDVHFSGRRDDCAANDLSVGVLVRFGDFRYLVAGDLTGEPAEDVADVESLLTDDAADLDVYHVNHHGSETSSSVAFIDTLKPTVAVVSNGRAHGHPRATVIQRLLDLNPPASVFATNFNDDDDAWNENMDAIADQDFDGWDGLIELQVWSRSYRVFLWRDGAPLTPGDRFLIKKRP